MKILLIYPDCLEERIHAEDAGVVPMGLYYLGALLRQHGYAVEIANAQRLRGRPEAVDQLLRQRHPDVIGCSVLNANRWGGIEICRRAKRILPDCRCVFGGVAATFLWRHFLTHFPEIDFVVLGEGERTLLELVRWIEHPSGPWPHHIDGLAFRCDGQPQRTPPAEPLQHLDELPNPARHFPFQHLALTRGCPADCTFCGSPRFWGRKVRSHSAAYFVEMIEHQVRRGIGFFYVSDDTFTVNRRRAMEVCRMVVAARLPVTWAAISRVDMVDEELLGWMRRAGCIQISYGVESGSESIRRRLNKRFSNAQVARAFDLTAGCGIMARAYFIYGCPGEGHPTIQASIDLMDRIQPLGAIFYILSLYPGTALFEDYRRASGATDDIWLRRMEEVPYFETDPHMSTEQVRAWGGRLRSEFHRRLPSFARRVKLGDGPGTKPLNADFCSRLGLTFEAGDYADCDGIDGKPELAAHLYRRALNYHPDARAYLGLGLQHQKARDHEAAVKILRQGADHFPDHPQLNICLAVSLMNRGDLKAARDRLEPFAQRPETRPYLEACHQALSHGEQTAESNQKSNC